MKNHSKKEDSPMKSIFTERFMNNQSKKKDIHMNNNFNKKEGYSL